MTDERLLTAAKLYEQVTGRLDGDDRLLDHAGLPLDERTHSNLSFLNSPGLLEGDTFASTSLGQLCDSAFRTKAATEAVQNQHHTALSYLVGVTEQELDASSLRLPLLLLDALENDGALTTITGAGNPNTGKSNTMFLLADLARVHWDDLIVLSNVSSWDGTDILVQSMHDLLVELCRHRETPKFVVIDEASTHFDARTNRREVATQWTPALKRFSKLGVVANGVIGHTGKDLHPEQKRLTTLPFFKEEQTAVDFYSEWPADSDRPTGRRFGGSLINIEKSYTKYDPDDASPWEWNLCADAFGSAFEAWDQFLAKLLSIGPDE
ncbi:hypothetical protein [Salinigranum halophilum]|uniref:hypothetical protein n=1 Tax=Salinigranum halophilum TaxID=2565931 RepID=UPI00115F0A5E|nr:hypothetical protein [Salinigranum halophilum]